MGLAKNYGPMTEAGIGAMPSQSGVEAAERKGAPLERRKRFSTSLVWELNRRFYDEAGPEAWARAGVPFHVTCNPSLAEAYARVVVAFLCDCQADRPVSRLIVAELGAGHGRFSYLFLRRFRELHARSPVASIPFVYVMTDISEQSLKSWRQNKRLQQFVDEKILDFACFDVGQDRSLRLLQSGAVLERGNSSEPVVAIANYVFDSVPQDVFQIEAGRMHERLQTVRVPDGWTGQLMPTILPELDLVFENGPETARAYDDPLWDQILQGYKERLSDCEFSFPCTALQATANLAQLSGGRFLMLSADKGVSTEEGLSLGHCGPQLVIHGGQCFSVMVNYDAIGRYVELRGGKALHPDHAHQNLCVSAFLLCENSDRYADTLAACNERLHRFGPDDFYILLSSVAEPGRLDFSQMLAVLRASGWDDTLLLQFLPVWEERVAQVSEWLKREIWEAVIQVWEGYFPVAGEEDLAFRIGTLLCKMRLYPQALQFLEYSWIGEGPAPGVAYNMALCHYWLGQYAQALHLVCKALELDPEADGARALRIRLEALGTSLTAGADQNQPC